MHEELIAPEKLACFLKHPLAIDSDKVLVAQFELMACRSRIEAMSGAFGAKLDSRAVDFTRRSSRDLTAWYNKWDAILGELWCSPRFAVEADTIASTQPRSSAPTRSSARGSNATSIPVSFSSTHRCSREPT